MGAIKQLESPGVLSLITAINEFNNPNICFACRRGKSAGNNDVIYAEPDRSFGEEKSHGFTGMIGQLQREESDLSTIVAPTPGRLKAVDYLRTYPSDPLTLTSLKPSVLPAHLSLVRPFANEVWLGVTMATIIWSVTLWGLQWLWKWAVKGTASAEFTIALLYGSSALLEKPSLEPSVNISGQMLVGFWLVFCLIFSSGYKSSLIAHLTVLSTSQPLDRFEDLLERDGWQWIIEPWLYKGATLEYFSKHTDPVVQLVHRKMKVMVADKALQEVRKGGFTLIDHKNYIKVVVATRYTDSRGQTQFYISNKGISILATFGWGLRKGAPFIQEFQNIMHHLEDGGIIEYWTEDTIYQRVMDKKIDTTVNGDGFSTGDIQGTHTFLPVLRDTCLRSESSLVIG
ncbi:probable glutamate receptor [Scylla paramamosain]|uniref:probable glutamate receptor n=1 Tax=Scylla paramamosain TaxID=85552 RepID=UPI0030837B29